MADKEITIRNPKHQGDVLIHISLTKREYDQIAERATSRGLSPEDFLRKLLCPTNATRTK